MWPRCALDCRSSVSPTQQPRPDSRAMGCAGSENNEQDRGVSCWCASRLIVGSWGWTPETGPRCWPVSRCRPGCSPYSSDARLPRSNHRHNVLIEFFVLSFLVSPAACAVPLGDGRETRHVQVAFAVG